MKFDMSFFEPIINMRRELCFTQNGFADAANIPVLQTERFEANISQPNADALNNSAKYFELTTAWLPVNDAEHQLDDDSLMPTGSNA